MRYDKCKFLCTEMEFLGYMLSATGVGTDPAYIKKFVDFFPRPKNKDDLRRGLGMVQWISRHVPHLSHTTAHFKHLLKKNAKWVWTDIDQKHWDELIQKVKNTKILHHPNPHLPFIVRTDASDYAIGACLLQEVNGKEVLIECISRQLSKHELNYHTSEKELYAIIYALNKWYHHLLLRHFTVYTDHQNLTRLLNYAKQAGAGNRRLIRWANVVSEFSFTTKYIKGEENIGADYMSRESAILNPTHQPQICTLQYHNKGVSIAHQIPHWTLQEYHRKTILARNELSKAIFGGVRDSYAKDELHHMHVNRPQVCGLSANLETKPRRSARLQQKQQNPNYQPPDYRAEVLPDDPTDDQIEQEPYHEYQQRLLDLQNPTNFEDIFLPSALVHAQQNDPFVSAVRVFLSNPETSLVDDLPPYWKGL